MIGLLLPLLAIVVEKTTNLCADAAFDPLPTPWHVLLFLTIPLSIGLGHLAIERRWTDRLAPIGFVHGIALVVAAVYTLVFMKILLMSLIAVIIIGIGFLGLAPLFALLVLLAHTRNLRFLAGGGRIPSLRAGIVVGLALVAWLEAPSVATRVLLGQANAEREATRERAISLLQAAHDEETLLRACYESSRRQAALLQVILPFGDGVNVADARRIYFQATGTAFDQKPVPTRRSGKSFLFGSDTGIDIERGGDTVGGELQGLTLKESTIDGSIDARAGVAYAEWTLRFANASEERPMGLGNREARAEVLLPPSSVVSRLTLWVNGEPREAVFGSRSRVRAAYEAIVRQRRDPVLITTAGPDRILIQCFPVPSGGEMKVRFGITSPLSYPGDEDPVLPLPRLTSRNFAVPESVRHNVWYESKDPLRAERPALQAEHPKPALFAIRGALTDVELSDPAYAIVAGAGAAREVSWSPDPQDNERAIQQTRVAAPSTPPDQIVVVVDTSASMEDVLGPIAAALNELPPLIPATVLAAGAEPRALDRHDTSWDFDDVQARGGIDNIPALVEAWDLAASVEHGVILWIHGPQPVALSSPDALVQRWRRRPDGPRLIDVPAILGGRNHVLESIDSIPGQRTLARTGAVEDDLRCLFDPWTGTLPARPEYRFERAAVLREGLDPAQQTSDHLTRLFVLDQVIQLLEQDKDEDAVRLAVRYGLVTPVTGAVVLETDDQYERAGLSPTPAHQIPTIPEPEMWALLVLAALGLLFVATRKSA